MLIIWDYKNFYHCIKKEYGSRLKGLKYKEKRPNRVIIYTDEEVGFLEYRQDYLNKVRQIFSNGNGEIEYRNYRTCLGEEEKK